MERIKKCSNYLLFGLLSLFLCLAIFSQNTKVYATNYETISTEQVQAILDYYKTKDFDTEIYDDRTNNTSVYGDNAYYQNILNNVSASQIASRFNTYAETDYNWNWDDVSIIVRKGYRNASLSSLIIDFIISNKGLQNVNLDSYKINTHTPTYIYNTIQRQTTLLANQKIIEITIHGGTFNVAGTPQTSITLHPKRTPELTQDELYITNFTDILSINTTSKFYWDNVLYSISGDYLNFDSNGNVIQNEPISGDTESSLGFYFYDSQQEGVKEINLLSLSSFQPLNEWWYIGNDLSFTYHYYYYDRNNNSVVLADDNVDIVQSSNSGDTGKFYFPRIDRQHLDNLQNDTGYYLVLYIGSGDIVLANDFYSFVTYSSVVDSGATGTITNSSGDVTGNVDLTGVQAGINDVNQTLTNVPDISGTTISSGDVYNSLGFQIANDPYANFWYEFTQSLGQALTTSTKSYVDINYMGYVYRWDLRNMHNPLPADFQHFLQGITTCFMIYYLTKQIRILVNDLQSGGILSTAHGAVVGDDTFIAYF